MTHDAVVIGAGPAGATAALMLASAGWSVALVEKAGFPRRKVCGEFMSAASASILDEFGLGPLWHTAPGPPVKRVGVFAGEKVVTAPMPRARGAAPWGRVIGRASLECALLERAREAHAEIFQPMTVIALHEDGPAMVCEAKGRAGSATLRAPLVVAAHGSWEVGSLPTQAARPAAPADLLAFKARLSGCALPLDLMPLFAFPGGYGGLVHVGGEEVSLSCCIRRDVLNAVRAGHDGSAGEAVLSYIRQHCRGVAEATSSITAPGGWIGAGPINPGFRGVGSGRILCVGNAAGEAHPIVAEGISMAIQSGWLAAMHLIEAGPGGLAAAARWYGMKWLAHFGPRVAASIIFAALAMRPRSVEIAGPLLARLPSLVTLGARLSGKAT